MRPRPSMHNGPYRILRDAELSCHFRLTDIPRPLPTDFHDRAFVQFRARMRLAGASAVPNSTARDHVLGIVGRCTEVQVCRIDAAPTCNVARQIAAFTPMKHPKTIWNWAVVNLPRNAMGCQKLVPHRQLSITGGFDRALPKPTFVWRTRVNVTQKDFLRARSLWDRTNADMASQEPGLLAWKLRPPKWLAAAAHTQGRQIGVVFWWVLSSSVSFDVKRLFTRIFGFGDGRSASTFAELWGVVRGIMGLHKNLLSSCVVPPGDPTRRGGVFIGYATGVIIAQVSQT
jgi:hypothetical protein